MKQMKQRRRGSDWATALLAATLAVTGCAQTGPAAPQAAQSTAAAANPTPARPESVERLLRAMETEKMVEAIHAQMGPMATQMARDAGIAPQNRAAFERYMQRVSAIVAEEINWETFKGPMVQVYAKHYSEEEVQGLTAFYDRLWAAAWSPRRPP